MHPRACITTVVLVTAILLGEAVVAQTSHQSTANTSSAAAALHPVTKPAVSASSSITAPIQFIKVDGLNIAYKVIGQGKPIIFLAHFRGTLNDWDPAFVDAVGKSYRVILFDAPGVGRSPGVVSTSVTKWADQAVQFTHTLGIEHAVYLGWSMGGAAAQIIAINHPESVDKLLLLATGPLEELLAQGIGDATLVGSRLRPTSRNDLRFSRRSGIHRVRIAVSSRLTGNLEVIETASRCTEEMERR